MHDYFEMNDKEVKIMKYRFISFETYGSHERQYDCLALASEDNKKLVDVLFRELMILDACGHTHITVHETCSANIVKKYNIQIKVL